MLSDRVLRAMHKHAEGRTIIDSAETGCGRSTLLLSWISAHHRVFTLDEPDARGSVANSRKSPLLNPAGNVEFVFGPSQRTLPRFTFERPLQLVFIDGPHGFPFPQLEYYFLYPHLAEDALFILDDIHIPTIDGLLRFLREDDMFELLEIVDTTAFFRRTAAPLFDPFGDGWWQQKYNINRFKPLRHGLYTPFPPFNTRVYNRLAGMFGKSFAERVRVTWRRVFPRRGD